jgi:hypothetical protein
VESGQWRAAGRLEITEKGEIVGTPTLAGSYAFEIAVTISSSSHGYTLPALSYSIEVRPALTIPYALQLEPLPTDMASGQSCSLALRLRRADTGGSQLDIPVDVQEIYCFITADGFRIDGPDVATLRICEGMDPVASFNLQAFLYGSRKITLDFHFDDPRSQRVRIHSHSIWVGVRAPQATIAGPPVLPTPEVRVGRNLMPSPESASE